ncbi:hypothetical protein ACFX2F_006865 [Malus domestica]
MDDTVLEIEDLAFHGLPRCVLVMLSCTLGISIFIKVSPKGMKTMNNASSSIPNPSIYSSIASWFGLRIKVTGSKNGGWLSKTINQGRLYFSEKPLGAFDFTEDDYGVEEMYKNRRFSNDNVE